MISRCRPIPVAVAVVAALSVSSQALGVAPASDPFAPVLEGYAVNAAGVVVDPVAETIAATLREGPATLRIGEERAQTSVLKDFYGERDYEPVWLENGKPNARAEALERSIAAAPRDGLDPARYVLPSVDGDDTNAQARFDLATSALLIRWAMDLNNGRVSPRHADPDHFIYHRDLDAAGVLEGATLSDDLDRYFAGLAPASSLYRGLRRALLTYRHLAAAGGWEAVPEGPTLKPGMTDPRVAMVRRNLLRTGDLTIESSSPETYDQGLVFAVEEFQRRHGLDVDGAVGKQTVAALNVPVEERISQIELNMERARWLPPHLGDKHVFVNMAGFELGVYEYGSIVLPMRVIVGKTYRQTPVFSGQISYLEFNPYWTVPYSIATKDILPKAVQDPAYLTGKGIRVFAGGAEVNAYAVNWSSLDRGNFPYTFRQDPGRKNALGRVKFMFPNRHAVYLHDTPSRTLFSRTVRTFSSGCIRVERPLELAEDLLRDEGWNLARIRRTVDSGERTVARLSVPVPVHLTYVTAWSGEGGSINFRKDVYGRDKRLAKALAAKQ